MDNLVASLRALVISRKEPTTVGDLIADYKQFEGETLQVQSFGFDTVEDFLQSTGKFILKNGAGGVQVIPRADDSTAHIEKLVAKQKPAKKRQTPQVYVKKKELICNSGFVPGKSVRDNKNRWTHQAKNNKYKTNGRDFNKPWNQWAGARRNCGNAFLSNWEFKSAVTLELYCMCLKVSPPWYNVFTVPHRIGFLAIVVVDGVTYSTLGLSYSSPMEAKVACSQNALQSIQGSMRPNTWNRKVGRPLYYI